MLPKGPQRTHHP